MTPESKKRTTISVVIPAYRRPGTLRIALQSVAAQTRPPDEIVVVDDGITASVRNIVEQFDQTRYVTQGQRMGVAGARNVGIAKSLGEFIALLDDDDAWPPDKLAWQEVALLSDKNAALVCGGVRLVGADYGFGDSESASTPMPAAVPLSTQAERTAARPDTLLRKNPITSPGQTLIRRSTLDALGEPPFDTRIWGSDDWDLWIRLAERFPIVWDDRVALLYRVHDESASRDLVRMYKGTFRLIRKHQRRQAHQPARLAILAATRQEYEQALITGSWSELAQQRAGKSTFWREFSRYALAFPTCGLRKIGHIVQAKLAGRPKKKKVL